MSHGEITRVSTSTVADGAAKGRILVIRGGAIGDFILTLPVFAALRSGFPGVALEVLGYPHIARLAAVGGLVDAVHAIEGRSLAGFFARGGDLDPRMAAFFSEFALIISFLYDPDEIFRSNVAACTPAQFMSGPHRPDPEGPHACDVFLRTLQQLAIFEADGTPRLRPEAAPVGSGRWVAMHPGSGSETKNWPERRWAELVRRVVDDTSCRVLLVGGEAEGDRLDRLSRGLPPERVFVARQLPLDALAARLAACEQFVGHDSGITHLAAAVGVPCLVLWGPSPLAVWRPRGKEILVLQDDTGLAGMSTDSVWEVLRSRLAALAPASLAPAKE
ncbi:MAG: glycosyltransferase family 9 protein [Verrucomicrobiales bacterium]|nr:glycosyltransferase family 9 protein [Verrucomicrobiales bacterium]